jgi:hypothetical protein
MFPGRNGTELSGILLLLKILQKRLKEEFAWYNI